MSDNKVSKLFIPEVMLHHVVSTMVKKIRDNFNSSDEKKSFLYRVCQDTFIGKYNFFEQAKEVFLRGKDDERYLDVELFFNAEKAHIPTIHINLPQEQPGEDGMGDDEGFNEPIFDDPSLTFIRQFNRRFTANYQILYTSNNSLECIMLYRIMQAAFIAHKGSLELLGFSNSSLSGGDLQLRPDIVPVNVFVRGMTFKFSYEIVSPKLEDQKFYTDIFIKDGKPIL